LYLSTTAGSILDIPVFFVRMPSLAKREVLLRWNAVGAKAIEVETQARRATLVENFIVQIDKKLEKSIL
jgi:hypothetical protein